MTPARAHRSRIAALVPPEVLQHVRRRSTIRGVGMILFDWGLIAAAIALVALTPHPALLALSFPLAVAVIGSRQLGLAILMHEGAHGGLARSGRLNLQLSQWFCAYPVFAETIAYRRYHLRHHAHAQTLEDPDLVLSAPFPVTPASLRRKIVRDLTARTGLQQRAAQLREALGPAEWPLCDRMAHFGRKLGGPLGVNAVIFAVLAAAGVWWAYPLLWLLPLLTWQQMVTRIRNIAEHSLLAVGGDPLKVARTTLAGPLARLFLAPHRVNYHAEHHLWMYVPCYNLPVLHRALRARGVLDQLVVSASYARVLAHAAARTG